MDANTIGKLSSRYSKLAAISLAITIFLASIFAVLWVAFLSETRSFARESLNTTQQINEKTTLAIGTLHSMSTVHQASPNGFDHRQFEMFAQNLVENQAAVTATGRYQLIPDEDLEYIASELQQQGTFQFAPKTLGKSGEISELDNKQQYNSVLAFHPHDPVSAKFIGLDLNEIESARHAIAKSVREHTPVAAALPAVWLSQGQINVYSPSYYGRYIPDSEKDRTLQTDGGYFITLDVDEIVIRSAGTEFPLSVAIALYASEGKNLISKTEPGLNEARYGKALFKSRTIQHNISIGAGLASIVYGTPAGVTKSQLLSAFGKALASLLLFLLTVSIFYAYRKSQAQSVADKKALAQERERALVTLNSIQDAVITADSEDRVDFLNPSMLQILRSNKNELIGTPIKELLDKHFKDEDSQAGNDVAKDNAIEIGSKKRLISDENEELVFDCHSSIIVDNNEDKIGAVLTMRDISKEHQLTTELAYQATHDSLTGLANRRKFESVLSALLNDDRAAENGSPIIGYIDLDQFKLVNDTVGHAAGDQLLKKLATDLEILAPKNVDIARLGGDEFGFICANPGNDGPEKIAEIFYDFFQSYFYKAQDNIFSIRASIGLTTLKTHHININDVLSEVDIACYTAKDAGRNNFVIYDSQDRETREREGEMHYLPILQSALKNNRFTLYTQPIVSTLGSNSAHHYECLLRLIDEDGSIITPYKFIVAAERYDLIRDIDRWVLDNAFMEIAKLNNTPLQYSIFSINLSGQSAVDSAMPDFIQELMQKHNINPRNICFELTETAVISNLTQAQKLIAFLREKGCTIALDDFGAGASSFGYLKNLQVDYLKIDGQFVKEMTSNKVDFEMVHSMQRVGEALGIKTIAEFVENETILNALREINVDFAQGFHLGKPVPMSNLLDDNQIPVAA